MVKPVLAQFGLTPEGILAAVAEGLLSAAVFPIQAVIGGVVGGFAWDLIKKELRLAL